MVLCPFVDLGASYIQRLVKLCFVIQYTLITHERSGTKCVRACNLKLLRIAISTEILNSWLIPKETQQSAMIELGTRISHLSTAEVEYVNKATAGHSKP